jgi:hypothetical protein
MTKDEALKLALEALEDFKKLFVKIQELGMYYGSSSKDARIGEVLIHDRAITAIKEALAQPEQEPVAWADKQSLDQIANFDATIYAKGGFDNATALYTKDIYKEPERPWVGLTDKAIWLEYQMLWPFHPAEEPQLAKDIVKFAKAIGAKLREKNT